MEEGAFDVADHDDLQSSSRLFSPSRNVDKKISSSHTISDWHSRRYLSRQTLSKDICSHKHNFKIFAKTNIIYPTLGTTLTSGRPPVGSIALWQLLPRMKSPFLLSFPFLTSLHWLKKEDETFLIYPATPWLKGPKVHSFAVTLWHQHGVSTMPT